MLASVYLMIIALLFGIYGWLSSIEVGISWLRLQKSDVIDAAASRRWFTPLWEVTNVFLVFGFTGFAVIFNNSLPQVSEAVFGLGAFAIGCLLVRAATVLYLYYQHNKLGWSLANLLFAATSLLIPLTFGCMGIRLITGSSLWNNSVGMALAATLLLGILAVASSFVLFVHRPHYSNAQRIWTAICTVAFAGVGTLVVQRAIVSSGSHLAGFGFLAWSGLLDFTLLFTAAVLFAHREQWLWWWLSLVAVTSPIIWAWANRPYLLYPGLLQNAYGAQAYGQAGLIGIAIVAPIIVVGIALFVKLYTSQPKSKEH